MTDRTYCLLFVRLRKTETNDDAQELVADFDNHCGLFASSSSSIYNRNCLGYVTCYRSA